MNVKINKVSLLFFYLLNTKSCRQVSLSHLSWEEPVLDSFPPRQTIKASSGDKNHAREVTDLETTQQQSYLHKETMKRKTVFYMEKVKSVMRWP